MDPRVRKAIDRMKAEVEAALRPLTFGPIDDEMRDRVREALVPIMEQLGRRLAATVEVWAVEDEAAECNGKIVLMVRGPAEVVAMLRGVAGPLGDPMLDARHAEDGDEPPEESYRLRFELPDGTPWEDGGGGA